MKMTLVVINLHMLLCIILWLLMVIWFFFFFLTFWCVTVLTGITQWVYLITLNFLFRFSSPFSSSKYHRFNN